MKFALLLIGLSLSFAVVAEVIPGIARNIKINHIVIGRTATASVQVPCRTADTDLNCYEQTAFKDFVEVTVDYSANTHMDDESFKVSFDASEFSADELARLSIRSAVKRIQAAKEIFELKISKERRTGSRTYCPYEIPASCKPGEEWTDTYDNEVTVVELIKK